MNQNEVNNEYEIGTQKEKKDKKTIILSVSCVVLFIIGLLIGPYILKGLTKNIQSGSFMYNILTKAGLYESSNEKKDSGSNTEKNKYVFSTSSNGYYYYYMIDEEGTYLYYYSKEPLGTMYYYGTDANGDYIHNTYMDDYEEQIIGKVNQSKLNVRSDANSDTSEVIGKLSLNDEVIIMNDSQTINGNGCDAGWYEIYFEEEYAYVCSKYITLNETDVEE